MISVENITKVLPSGKVLLDGISFKVKKGEFLGILGASGAGKSLTLRCMVGLIKPTDGQIIYSKELDDDDNPINICELKGKKLRNARKHLGVIFQGNNLVKRLTALENVMIGRLGQISPLRTWIYGFTDAEAEEAYEALKQVKMEDYSNRRVGSLSGGEQQRVAIARAIFQNPSVYLADEPVSSLDPKNAKKILKLLAPLAENKPVIGVFHQPHLVSEFCTRVIAVKDGSVVYDGDPKLSEEQLEMIYADELSSIQKEAEKMSLIKKSKKK
ncbi:MAG: ATP-binding cassette domain-containing protein [Opitutales bacterium]|nr:ATP-binding cassette domain-containing protein [Opitutales bacterium]